MIYDREKWSEIPEELIPILKDLDERERNISAENPNILKRGKDMINKGLPSDNEEYYSGNQVVNVIPGGKPGICHRVLIVAIGSSPAEYYGIGSRILLAVEHIWAKCPNITKFVIFWVNQWNDELWNLHKNSFRNVKVVLRHFKQRPLLLR